MFSRLKCATYQNGFEPSTTDKMMVKPSRSIEKKVHWTKKKNALNKQNPLGGRAAHALKAFKFTLDNGNHQLASKLHVMCRKKMMIILHWGLAHEKYANILQVLVSHSHFNMIKHDRLNGSDEHRCHRCGERYALFSHYIHKFYVACQENEAATNCINLTLYV